MMSTETAAPALNPATQPASEPMPNVAVQRADGAEPAARPEGAEPREKRSRDRYGRERGPRGDRAESADRQERPVRDLQATLPQEEVASEPRKSYFTASAEAPVAATESVRQPVTETPAAAPAPVRASAPASVAVVIPAVAAPVVVATPVTAAPVKPVSAPAPVVETAVAAVGMPKLQPFALPLAELAQVAQNSGLNWVNSNAEKIAAVQAAIAAEPKPVRVPRERPAAVKIEASPLVMIETKRDLRDMTLPFEAEK